MKNRSFEVICHKQIRNARSMGSFWAVVGYRNDVARLVHFNQWFGQHIQNSALPTFHLDVSHPKFISADIPPGCITSGIMLRRHSTRMFHIRNSSPPTFHPDFSHPAPDAGWERRAFQLPRSNISGSSDSAYPESFAAILHSAAVFSWSFQICATDILRYFALDIWWLNPQTLLVTHQS